MICSYCKREKNIGPGGMPLRPHNNSPHGLICNRCAKWPRIGTILRRRDGNLYQVILRNHRLHWKRILEPTP